jgi:RNA polymerase sigma-70 factor (ECF subfamily)
MNETPLTEPSDAVLVARAKEGDADAFGFLYRRYVDAIYRYLSVRLGDVQEAEDLTEDVFFRSFQSLGDYRERGWPFSAFLYRVAKNMLIDYYRQKKPEIGLTAAERVAGPLHPLDDHVIRGEQLSDLRQAIDAIQPNYREVIILRVILALPTSVVARWMDQTEGATRVLLHRALASVRRELRECNEQ